MFTQTSHPAADSAKVSSKPDTVAVIKQFEPAGRFLYAQDPLQKIDRTRIRWGDYGGLSDVLWQIPGVFIRDLGSVGQPNQATSRGLGWHHVSFLVDGREVNELLTGVTTPSFLPVSGVERIEYETGTRSFLYGLSGTGGAVNIITEDFDSDRPYSRVHYSEGGYSLLSTDGIFSQNLSRRFNLAAAFHRSTLDGRFPNTDYDAWNVRIKLRYLISKRMNLSISETYNGTQVGLNGGVDVQQTPSAYVFDELLARVRNTDSYEKTRRHDLTATVGVLPFSDSISVWSVTAYYSNNLRQYRDEENRPNPNGIFTRSDHQSEWYGVKVAQRLATQGSDIHVGAELQERRISTSPNVGVRHETHGNVIGLAEKWVGALRGAVFGRYDRLRGEGFFSYGADAKLRLLTSLSAYGGYSHSNRAPSIQELYWIGGGVDRLSPLNKERHRLVEVGLIFQHRELLDLRFTFFQRDIHDRIVVEPRVTNEVFQSATIKNIPEETLRGADLKMSLHWWKFSAEGTLTYLTHHRGRLRKEIYPRLFTAGEISGRIPLFANHLDLKVGLRGKFFTRNYGEQFNPESMLYIENEGKPLDQHGSTDLFLVGKVGKAYLHVLLENLTDERAMLTPYFPIQDRKVRFGVEWEFLD